MSVKKIAMNGILIALFVMLSLCLQVPVFENYYLCLGYAVMTVACYSFGAVSGILTGTLGVVLYCVLINGLRGMPGWAAGNVLIGLVLGLMFPMLRKVKNTFVRYILSVVLIAITAAAGILLIKSAVESFLYAQPMLLRIAKNVYAFVADAVMIAVSFPVAELIEKQTNVSKWYC